MFQVGLNSVVVTAGIGAAVSATLGGKALTVVSSDVGAPVLGVPENFPLLWLSSSQLVVDDGSSQHVEEDAKLWNRNGWASVVYDGTVSVDSDVESMREILVDHLGVTPEAGDQLRYTTQGGLSFDAALIPSCDSVVSGFFEFYRVNQDELLGPFDFSVDPVVGVLPPKAGVFPIFRVSGGAMVTGSGSIPTGVDLYVQPDGTISNKWNGKPIAVGAVFIGSGVIQVYNEEITAPCPVYLSPVGKLTATPNGEPIGMFRV